MNATMTPRQTKTQSSSLAHLHALVHAVQVRLRLREATRLAPIAIALGLAATAILALVWRLRNELSLLTLLVAGALLIGAAIVTAFLYAWFRPRDPMYAARQADHLLSLDERIATALEASTKPLDGLTPVQEELREAQLEDALTSAKAVSMRRDIPLAWQRNSFAPAGLFFALLLVIAATPYPLTHSDRAVQAQIAQEQQKIAAAEQLVKASPRLAQDPALQALVKELSELSRDLSSGDLKREEALARLSEAESKLQKTLDADARSQRAALDELAKQLAESGSDAAKQAGEALKAGDTQQAADALKNTGANADKMTPEERKALADALKQARDNIASLYPETARALNEAADALSGRDPQAAQKALEALGERIAETGQNLATQQQISQALAQLQQSKQNIAQVGPGLPTSQPGNGTAIASGTALANVTPIAGGTALAGGTPIAGTPVALGSPVQGRPVGTGTPSPGSGTPVLVPGQGDGSGQGQNGGQGDGSGNQPGGGNPSGQSSGGNKGWGTGHQEPVYAPPSSLSATLTPIVIQGRPNPGGEQSTAPINGGTGTGQAQVPYEQVFPQYQEQAGNALNSDYIPQGYKDLVRDYFSELQP